MKKKFILFILIALFLVNLTGCEFLATLTRELTTKVTTTGGNSTTTIASIETTTNKESTTTKENSTTKGSDSKTISSSTTTESSSTTEQNEFKLSTPVVTLSEDGIVSWEAVENAASYIINVTGTEYSRNKTTRTVDLQYPGNYIKVKAVGSGSYIDSEWSETYYYLFLDSPTVLIKDNVASWEAIENAQEYIYRINGGQENTTQNTSIELNIDDSIEVMASSAYYIDSFYSHSKTNFFAYSEMKSDILKYASSGYYDILGKMPNGERYQAFYAEIQNACYLFHVSNEDVIIDEGKYLAASVDYLSYNLTNEEAQMVYEGFKNDNPIYYWLSNEYGFSSKRKGDEYIEKNLMLYVLPDYAIASVKKETSTYVYQACECFSNYIDSSMSYAEKIRIIHDEIIKHMKYAYDEHGIPDDTPDSHSIVGYTKYGRGVCESYAEMFALVSNYYGINTLVITGQAYSAGSFSGHAWNLVVGPSYSYWCDLTWDDNIYKKEPETTYFMVTDNEVCDSYKFTDDHRADTTFQYPTRSTTMWEYK